MASGRSRNWSAAVSGVFFPIGVLLYWLTTNVWSMGQQAYVIKRMPPVNLNPGKTPPAGKDGKANKDGKDPKDVDAAAGKTVAPAPAIAGADVVESAADERSTTPAALPARVGGRGVTPKAPVSAAANRRPTGSRKNKNRRGGRR